MFEFFKKIFKRKPKEVEPPDLMEARAYLDSLKPKALKMFADGELTVKDILKLDMHWPVDADLLKKIQEHEEVDQTEANELLRTSCKSLSPETAERHVPAGFYVALDVPAEKRNEFKTYFDRSRNLKETCERMTHYQRRAVDAALDLKVAEELS